MSAETKKPSLADLAKKINTKYAKETPNARPIVATGDQLKEQLKPKFLPTGIHVLDEALGGGLTMGAVNTFTGVPGCGKTCAALMAVAQCQKRGGTAVWVDAEPPFPYLMALMLGVDLDSLWIIKPKDYGEQILDVLKEMLFDNDNRVTRGIVDLVVVDSINGLVPKAQLNSQEKHGYEGQTVGRRAAMLSRWLEELSGMGMLREDTVMLPIAQMRVDVNAYGAPEKMSGGKALEYMSKTRTILRKKALDGKSIGLGHIVTFKVDKNNTIGRLAEGEYTVLYGSGVDDSVALVTIGLEREVVKKTGRTDYSITLADGAVVAVSGGIDALRTKVREDGELRRALRETIEALPPMETEPIEYEDEETGDEPGNMEEE